MFGLAVEVLNIQQSTLPRAVYALLSGFNASTVSIFALAAVKLFEKVITDRTTHMLVFLGATAGRHVQCPLVLTAADGHRRPNRRDTQPAVAPPTCEEGRSRLSRCRKME